MTEVTSPSITNRNDYFFNGPITGLEYINEFSYAWSSYYLKSLEATAFHAHLLYDTSVYTATHFPKETDEEMSANDESSFSRNYFLTVGIFNFLFQDPVKGNAFF